MRNLIDHCCSWIIKQCENYSNEKCTRGKCGINGLDKCCCYCRSLISCLSKCNNEFLKSVKNLKKQTNSDISITTTAEFAKVKDDFVATAYHDYKILPDERLEVKAKFNNVSVVYNPKKNAYLCVDNFLLAFYDLLRPENDSSLFATL